MPILHNEPFARRYHAPLISTASLLGALAAIAILILPFVFAYVSGSFWLKQNSFREQPQVMYKHEFMLLLEGVDRVSNNPVAVVWSSSPLYNQLHERTSRVAALQTSQIDVQRDGKYDYITFSASIPLLPTEAITHVRLALFFQYSLSERLRLQMQSMALFDSSTALPASSVYVDGDLRLVQRELLKRYGDNAAYNIPVVNFTKAIGPDPNALTWSSIMAGYARRDVRTNFAYETPIWTTGRAPTEPFVVSGRVAYSTDTIQYLPGAWEVLKNGWIQYLAYLILVGAVISWILGFAFRNQVVRTAVRVDQMPRYGGFKAHAF
ncbi:hypothetical protein SpCBS45565_g03791 [Spizellomyces sp. 'palustris']|nr:hypothetical protein SpCBS45565_g03791 [Spizellomyces sp. 'palustris']